MSKLFAVMAAGAAMVASVPAQAVDFIYARAKLTSVTSFGGTGTPAGTTPIEGYFDFFIDFDPLTNAATFRTISSEGVLRVNRSLDATGEAVQTGNRIDIQASMPGSSALGINANLFLQSVAPAGVGYLTLSETTASTVTIGTRFLSYSGVIVAATTAVPEPSTWAMMMAGLGIVGGGLRRRRRTAVTFA